MSFTETTANYKKLADHGDQETLARLWNQFVDTNEFFKTLKKRTGYNGEHLIHIHPNTKEELLKAFNGDCKRLLDAMFNEDNNEGVRTYYMDAKWFTTDGNDEIITDNTVDDMIEHIITDWCDWTEYRGAYEHLWYDFMMFALAHYEEEDKKHQEDEMEEARREREAENNKQED